MDPQYFRAKSSRWMGRLKLSVSRFACAGIHREESQRRSDITQGVLRSACKHRVEYRIEPFVEHASLMTMLFRRVLKRVRE